MQRNRNNFSPQARLALGLAAIALLGASAPQAAHASTITIDAFTLPVNPAVQAIKKLNPGPKLLVKQDDPGVLGGSRDVLFEVNGVPENSTYTGTIGNGVFVYAAGTSLGTVATLQYDGSDADTPGANPALIDNLNIGNGSPFDLTDGMGPSNAKFVLDFLSAQAGPSQTQFAIEIVAVSTSGSATYSGFISENENPFAKEIEFSEFIPTGTFNFAQLRSLKVVLNKSALPAVDFELTEMRVEIVPEPSSIVLGLCGAGAVGFTCWRRKRRPAVRRG